jgi:hypothetical protein
MLTPKQSHAKKLLDHSQLGQTRVSSSSDGRRSSSRDSKQNLITQQGPNFTLQDKKVILKDI